jgi:C1A family cysteine protease
MNKLAAVLALGTAGAENFVEGGTLSLSWKDCGDASTKGKVTSLAPASLTLGTKTKVTGAGTVSEGVTAGKIAFGVKASIVSKTFDGDLCSPKTISLPLGVGSITYEGVKCPLAAGAVSVPVDILLSSALPSSLAKASINIEATSSTGDKLLCMAINTAPTVASDPSDMASDPDFSKFADFIGTHRGGAGYASEVETIGRFNIFKSNLRLAEERHARAAANAKPGRKTESHGVTRFMDLSAQEFSATYKGLIPAKNLTAGAHKLHTSAAKARATAQSIDWNAKGALTKVKNQGQCGSCWAFSATEQLESQYFQKYGTLKELSPQQLTSCDTTDNGCQGGNPINAWGYISGFGGQEDAADYPYTSGTTKQSGTCKSNKADIAEDVGTSYSMISSKASEESNMLAQIQESPMSVCVDATLWQTYTGGVITASSGCGTSIDHAVQATGYNAEGNYWIVRNSWAESWGENGFVWVEAGSNVCGITSQATIVTVEKIMGKSTTVVV